MKLSIIIPMYNCERYVADCLDSILNSNLPKSDYEVIVINDGSKDRGPEIAQNYAARHNNIRYLTQENQGQSVARNYGIRESKGEYLWCIDADDKIKESANSILDAIEPYKDIDILTFQLEQVTEKGEFISYECSQTVVPHNKLMKGCEAVLAGYAPSSVCALLIRKKLMVENDLFFKVGITQQDVELSYRLMSHANDVYFSDFTPYLYIHHKNTTSKQQSPQKKVKYECDKVEIIKSFRKLSEEFSTSDQVMSKKIKQYADGALFGCVYGLFRNRKQWKPLGVNMAVLTKLKDEGYYPLQGPYDSWKKRLAAILLNIEALVA